MTAAAAPPRLGEGELAFEPARSVFINCPFDAQYAEIFDAIIFCTICCGFMPRSALESGTVAQSRLERITRALFDSRYSLHDLSRCRGEGDQNLARFNMPLELGIAMARRFMNQPPVHDWTVLVPEGNLYTRVISDLAAYDPPKHDGSLRSAVFAVTKWLCTRENATPLVADVTPVVILDALPAFMTRKHTLEAQWGPDPPWPWLLQAAFAVAKSIN